MNTARPPGWARAAALAAAHGAGLVGAIILALRSHLHGAMGFDKIPLVVVAAVGLAAAALIIVGVAAVTRSGYPWLIVAGVWIYAAVIAGLREPDGRAVGYALVFAGYAIGALATYVAEATRR